MKGKILIVDDEPNLCECYARFLKKAGYEVDIATDSEGGLDAAISGNYQLIILDLIMPGRGGFKILKAVSVLPSADKPQVILVTGKSEIEIKNESFLRDEAVRIFFKPLISLKKLAEEAEKCVSRCAANGHGKLNDIFYAIGAVSLAPNKRLLKILGHGEIRLTRCEAKFVKALMRNAVAEKAGSRQHLSRTKLIKLLWSYEYRQNKRAQCLHALASLTYKLRNKLGSFRNLVEAVRAGGYRFNVNLAEKLLLRTAWGKNGAKTTPLPQNKGSIN